MKRLFTIGLIGLTALCASAQSLLPDGGFEERAKAWRYLCFAPAEPKEANATFTLIFRDTHSGSKAGRLSSDDFARHAITGRPIPVAVGERYRLTAWTKAEANAEAKPGQPGILIRLTLSGADKTEVPGGHYYIGLGNWVARDKQPAPPADLPLAWTQIDVVIEIPPGTETVVPSFFVWNAKGGICFDDISFEKVPEITPLTPLS